MDVFLGQLVGFAVIVWLLWRYVIPPVRRMMATQQETVRKQLEDSASAEKRLADAQKAHSEAVKRAKAEAKEIADEARADAEKISQQMRAQADAEVERIKIAGQQQVQLLRTQLIRQLRADLGVESISRAEQLVREHVSDPGNQAATIERFIDELDAMAPSEARVPDAVGAKFGSASRQSLQATVERFDEVSGDLDGDALGTLADELAAVAKLLVREPILSRHLAEPADDPAAKERLIDSVLGDKVGDPALQVLKGAASGRWSSGSDLTTAVEHTARLALLVRAEKDDQVDEVEEQLFRFGRVLDSQPRLSSLLGDFNTPVDGRVTLLRNVLDQADGISETTTALLTQTIELLRSGRADEAVRELAELAVAHRGEIVAHVSTPTDLSDAQRTRLTEVLSRIYSQPVSLQTNTDPELLGGLSIAVGDEVVDGTLASRLTDARTKLPD